MKGIFRFSVILLILSAFCVSTSYGSTKAIAIPSAYVLPEIMPFGALGNGIYQQVYDANLFPGLMIIRSVSFVPQDFGLPGFSPGKYEISFSVTQKSVCGLDGNDLTQNIGSNNLRFFKGKIDGGVTIRGKAYVYDPTKGNLLITVTVSGKPAPDLGVVRAAMMRGDDCAGSSRAFDFPQVPRTGADSVGLATIFVYSPVNPR